MLEEGLDAVKVPINSNLSRRGKTPQISYNLSTSACFSPLYYFLPFSI